MTHKLMLVVAIAGCAQNPCGDLDAESCMLSADAMDGPAGPMMLAACNQGSHQACVEVTTDLIQGSHGDTHRIELASRFARAGHAEGWHFALTYVGLMYAAQPTPDWVRAANWFSRACQRSDPGACVYEFDARVGGHSSMPVSLRDELVAHASSVSELPTSYFNLEQRVALVHIRFHENANQFPDLPLDAVR
jgi:hypothetical protein